MNHRTINRMSFTKALFLGLASFLVACGSGRENVAPTAAITTAATEDVPLNAVVVVDGSGSTDPEGAALIYAWRLTSKPPGSTADMTDPTAKRGDFTADMPGDYQVELVVNDGMQDSKPTTITIAVVRSAPTVTISSPEDNQVFSSTTVAVIGTVDDPGAAITVNGNAVANSAGNYTTNLTLSEGAHLITVVATNASGDGSAETTAVVNTQDNPVVWITSPGNGFIAGPVLSAPPAPATTTVAVGGFVKVNTLRIGFPDPNVPTVLINGQPATSVVRQGFLGCAFAVGGGISLDLCYRFSGTISVNTSQELRISVVAEDAASRQGSASVDGYVDYCIKGGFDGLARYQTDAGGRQNNRCHEIDGCSLYQGDDDEFFIVRNNRNNPAAVLGAGQLYNEFSTEFGSGEAPPQEFYIHGNKPLRGLPCNLHDQCYQTAGQSQAHCDFDKMFLGTHRICQAAYPQSTCPFTGFGAEVKCEKWKLERWGCYTAADLYYLGDVAFGASAFSERQGEYTYVAPVAIP
jgi:hypothetical protein